MRLLAVLLALVLAAPCLGASARWELIHTPAAAVWDTTYTADVEPPAATPSWNLYEVDKATVGGGILTIADAGNSACYYYRNGISTPAGSSLWAYIRIKTEFGLTDGCATLTVFGEGNYGIQVKINNSSLKIGGSTYPALLTYVDYVDLVVRQGYDHTYEVWLDGDEIASGTGTAYCNSGYVFFGGIPVSMSSGDMYIDTVAYCVIVDAAEVPPEGELTGGVYQTKFSVVAGTSPKAYIADYTEVEGTSPKVYVNDYEVP